VQGTGLGLVVVKLLTEQMQGRVEVASELGHGSTFSVWLRKAE
jgi:signal transduction histidine kinase